MANSKTDIVNHALLALGHRTILSFNDPSIEAQLARATYDTKRDAVLRAHPWNFSIKRASISADSETPAWEFDSQYTMPSDCLRVLELQNEDMDVGRWRIEGRKILTNIGAPLNIRYIFRNEVVTQYDPLFVEALSFRLAMDWVEPLVKAANLKEVMMAAYQEKLSEARTMDGAESTPLKIEADTWIDVR